jgi:hypothetical protein
MAKLLLECGAEIDALTNVNNTALQLGKWGFGNSSVEESNYKEIAKDSSECGVVKIQAVRNQIIYCMRTIIICSFFTVKLQAILTLFGPRSLYISINFPRQKPSENLKMYY